MDEKERLQIIRDIVQCQRDAVKACARLIEVTNELSVHLINIVNSAVEKED